MPSSQDESTKNLASPLSRRSTIEPTSANRLSSSRIPDRLKGDDDDQEDLTAPPRDAQGREGKIPYGVFSILAVAGSKSEFHSQPDVSSDSDDDEETESRQGHVLRQKHPRKYETRHALHSKRISTDGGQQESVDAQNKDEESDPRGRRSHRRHISDHAFFKPLHGLPPIGRRARDKDRLSRSEIPYPQAFDESEAGAVPQVTPKDGLGLSRAIQLRSPSGPSKSPERQERSKEDEERKQGQPEQSPAELLSTRLKQIFGFEKQENILAEYQCWLVQSVLLQGHMYVTERHICFYAYLPKKSHSVIKSGYLSKRGRQNPKYSRYWCALKGDVLSYYLDPSNLYFPSGHVDLRRNAISANHVEPKDKDKVSKDFVVTTESRTYQFRADSVPSAKEWVKALQKVIFRSHNDGDSVKISLPIENIIDIEDNPMLDCADTCKIRVVESGDSYAMDEYFFSFFDGGPEAVGFLRDVINETAAPQQTAQERLAPSPRLGSRRGEYSHSRDRSFATSSGRQSIEGSPMLQESVKATLRPPSRQPSEGRSPRRSADAARASLDGARRSGEFYSRESFEPPRTDIASQRENKQGTENTGHEKLQSSPDSFVAQSLEQPTDSSAVLQSATSTSESASRILNRSDVFHSPTIHSFKRSASQPKESGPRRSHDTARSAHFPSEVGIQPPSRARTGESQVEGKRSSEFHETVSESEHATHDADKAQNLGYSTSSPTLQDLVKAGTYPLQRAAGFAGYLKNRSKRMSNLLASESMGYIEKVSGMWTGAKKHYGEDEGVISSADPEDVEQGCDHGDRFRAHFALPSTEKLHATYFGYLHRVLPLYGKMYISNRKVCFRSLLPGTRTKMILPLKDVENVEKEKGFRFGYSGLVVIVSGHEELFFEFSSSDARDDCAVTLHQGLESIRFLVESGILAQQEKEEAETARAEHLMLHEARLEGNHDGEPHALEESSQVSSSESSPILFDDPRASIINFKPNESLRITCLTIGSRGDIQPYIALCKGLLAEGHQPKIATHREFEPWVRKYGIDFAPVDGDPAELMRICIENGMFTYAFLREASAKFRGWIDDLLSSAWSSCQGSDILIESPSAMAGIHIADALQIPYFRAFTMPWTRTRAYPHAFAVPEHKMGGAYNYISYVMFDNVFWKAIAGQVNRWRKKELGLRSTSLDRMHPNKVPFLYNFSPSVVPPPLDYSDWIRVTGYWFLDESSDWQPPEELSAFIYQARKDGKKIVYIGFGSIVVSDPTALTKTVVDSVQKADVRCILSKGWSDRLGDPTSAKVEIPLPAEICQINSAPHDWLFPRVDAVAHHGGAGTTGASLRAGVPTIVKPFFGDQFFFGGRIEDLGVGICMRRLNTSVFSKAMWEATRSERMIVKATKLGEQIRKEDGVGNAIQALYRDLEYAKTLVRQRSDAPHSPKGYAHDASMDDDLAAIEDSWTIIP